MCDLPEVEVLLPDGWNSHYMQGGREGAALWETDVHFQLLPCGQAFTVTEASERRSAAGSSRAPSPTGRVHRNSLAFLYYLSISRSRPVNSEKLKPVDLQAKLSQLSAALLEDKVEICNLLSDHFSLFLCSPQKKLLLPPSRSASSSKHLEVKAIFSSLKESHVCYPEGEPSEIFLYLVVSCM